MVSLNKVFSNIYGALLVVKDGFEGTDKDTIATEFGATAAEIAENAGVSELEAGKALVQLYYEDDYSDVEMLMTHGFDAPHYWREVGQ